MENIAQGLVLMAAGMGIVYTFLTVLIITTKIACGIVGRFDGILPQEAPKKAPSKALATNEDADIALAIAVALG